VNSYIVEGDAWSSALDESSAVNSASFQALGMDDTGESSSKNELSVQVASAIPDTSGASGLGVTASDLFHALQPELQAKSTTSGLEHSRFGDFDPLLEPVTTAQATAGHKDRLKTNRADDSLSNLMPLWPCERIF